MWTFFLVCLVGSVCVVLVPIFLGYCVYKACCYEQAKQVESVCAKSNPESGYDPSSDRVKVVCVKDWFVDVIEDLVKRREELEKKSTEKPSGQKKVLVGSFSKEFVDRMTDTSGEVQNQQPET